MRRGDPSAPPTTTCGWLPALIVAGLSTVIGCATPGPEHEPPPADEPYTEAEQAEIEELTAELAERLSQRMPANGLRPVGEPIAPSPDGQIMAPAPALPELPTDGPVDVTAYDDVDDLAAALARKYFDAMRNRYIVVLDEAALRAGGDNRGGLLARLRINPRRQLNHALHGFVAELDDNQLRALRADPAVVLVERDAMRFATALAHPKGVDRVDADLSPIAAIDGSPTAVGVAVAIVDTGIDLDHADLNVVGGQDFVTIAGDSSPGGDDRNGHGTHCAGIVGARDDGPDTFSDSYPTLTDAVVGVAPGVPLWALRVLGSDGSGYVSDILRALDWITVCVQTGPTACGGAGSIRVVNYSLGGGGGSVGERTAIEGVIAAGVTFVAAAGNDNADVGTQDACVFSPGCYDAPIVVAALTDYDGARGEQGACGPGEACNVGPRLCHYCSGTIDNCFYETDVDDATGSYSNYGTQIDLVAPGTCVLSTAPTGGCFSCYRATTQLQGRNDTLCVVEGGHNPYQYRACRDSTCSSCTPAVTDPPELCGYSDQMCASSNPNTLYCCSGGEPYIMMSGTSMATPHVTGGAALYIAEYFQNHGSYPTHEQVKAGLVAQADSAPCGAGQGADCERLAGKPALYVGNSRQAMEGSYSPVTMYTNGDAIAEVVGSPDPVFDGSQSLLVGVNDTSALHGYSSVKVCLNEDSASSSLDDYFEASMHIQLAGLVDWTGIGISGKDGTGTDAWLYWWWLDAGGALSDEGVRFPAGTIAINTWHELAIAIDRRATDPATHTAEVLIDGVSAGAVPLTDIAPAASGSEPMRCLFVYTGVQDDTQQEIFIDAVHLSARPEGNY